MATIRAADGGEMLNSEQFYYTKDAQRRPVLNIIHTETETVIPTDFIVTLTVIDGQEGAYTADKGWIDIQAAFNNKENIAVSIEGKAILPLMIAEVANGNASFVFGYTQVSANGQLVHTRAVEYTYDGENETWVDVDEVGDYVKPSALENLATKSDIANMVTKRTFHQAQNTGSMYTLVDGAYMLIACDAGHSGVATIRISGDAFNVSHVSTLSSWTVTKGAVTNGVYINNTSTTNALDVYVIAL